ncbi:TPA: transcription-repair coupling factor, partial [Streptococcus suis]|nr:transcription-repair coupling factor [Streptococcus suis]
MNILDLLHKNKQINQWQSGLNKSTRQLLLGLTGTSKSLVMATAYDSMAEKIMIVTATQNDAEKLVADLVAIIGSENVYNFFTDDSPIAEFVFASKERTQSRIDSLNFLTDSTSSGILVASMAACRVLLPSPETYKGSKIKLEVGQEIEVDKLVNNLVNIGYKKVSRVLTQGEFSQRGDILDIFDMQAETPYRIEFFGDEIDGIRIFDVDSQKSLENLDEISISPASDIILSSEDYSRASQYIQTAIEQSTLEEQQSYLREVLADMQTEYRHPDLRKFLSCIYEQSWTLLDYLPKSSPLFLDDFHKISDKQAQFEKEIADLLTDDLQKGKTVSSLKYFASTYAELRKYKPATFFSSFQKGLGNVK